MREELISDIKVGNKTIPIGGKIKILHRVEKHIDMCTLNPILGNGEICIIIFDDGERSFKIGDGITNYNDLPFFDQPIKKKYNRTLKRIIQILIASCIIKLVLYFYGDIDMNNLGLVYIIMTMIEFILIKIGGKYK